ncbi:kinase-like protein, partial [Serendipita vermifera]
RCSLQKVKEEREIWWQLDHENVLPLLGFSEQFGRYGALIYPWCEGGNTGNYLRKPGNASERFQLWYGVVKAICYLHSHDPQVVHGDLKPTNVLISGGKAKVCDFGLLKLLAEETMGMTTTSAHIGTMRYLARELVIADDQPNTTSHTDVHALGCLGLEFLFLRIPYAERRNPAQIFKDIADSVPPSRILPVAGEPAIPIKQLWDKLNECWNPDPAKRPAAQELQDFVEANEAVIMKALENDFVPAPGLLE